MFHFWVSNFVGGGAKAETCLSPIKFILDFETQLDKIQPQKNVADNLLATGQ